MKKLFRETGSDKMLSGVASGLAHYFDIDVTLFRLIFALGFFTPMPVVITYIILWIVMPKKESYLIQQNH